MSARPTPQFKVRLPEDLKEWIKEQATKNCRSQTAEIVYRLGEAKKLVAA